MKEDKKLIATSGSAISISAIASFIGLCCIGPLLAEALKISDITRLEVHAPESQLALLREPLAPLNPEFFTLETGFRRE